jgi:hypothetical protein
MPAARRLAAIPEADNPGPDVPAKIAAERPRLMATTPAIERARSLLHQNTTAGKWQEKVSEQAELMLELAELTPGWVHDARETAAAPLPLVSPPKSADGQAAPLDIARLFCLRIQTLGLMWLLTLDPRYRDRAKSELLAVCDFPDWAGDKFLVTAETAFGAAIGLDWLYQELTEAQRKTIARAIVDKAIQPGLDQFAAAGPLSPEWRTTAMNWNLVCNGALMVAALSVWEFDDRARQLFSLCRQSVRTGFSEYRPDGGFVEGPGYWHYATQYAIYLLDSLKTALGTRLGLDKSPGLSRTGYFRLHAAGPSGKLFNFADGEAAHSGGYWLFWLARRYRHPIYAGIEQHGGKVHPMDLLWFEADGADSLGLPTAQRFDAAGVVMLRGDWGEPGTTYLGVKAGANNACEHGHYDLGSFVLDADEVRWAIDLGPDDYGLPGYFTPEPRSRYYRTSTIGHNTIVIDGACQPYIARAVVATRFEKTLALVALDLSTAYPSAASAWRGFALIERRHVLIVDEIEPTSCLSSVAWQMHTTAHVGLDDATATLRCPAPNGDATPLSLYIRVIKAPSGSLSLGSAAPSEPQGQNPNTGITKLVYRMREVEQPMRLEILLSPDADFCATFKLPARLRRHPSEWGRPPSDELS